jgi:prepilin-type N-terminal cleavage/methylation domain-containing protein
MNNRLSYLKLRKNHQGFTLVETVVAMGIITIMITAFLAAFAPAVLGIKKSISAKEANRLASTLEYELSVLRPDEVATYSTSFEKAYNWIKNSAGTTKNDAILLYQYRGDLTGTPNNDGTLPPYLGNDAVPGETYVLQSVVRRFDSTNVSGELVPKVVEGRVFYVRMVQLIYNTNGELIESTSPGEILDPRGLNAQTTYDTYPEAVIAYQAQVFVLKSNQYNYISSGAFDLNKDLNNDGYPDVLGRPIFTRNMAVRR